MSVASWRVLAPGALTTVQDTGRIGWRHLGVALAGAMDPSSTNLANHLLGNDETSAVLELTSIGPTLALPQAAHIAICGAAIDAWFEDVSGQRYAVPCYRPVTLPPGKLRLATVRRGLRAWLAVAGGFDVPSVLGSRSTDLRGGFGGIEGRALQAGDLLPLGAPAPAVAISVPQAPAWWIESPSSRSMAPIRFVANVSDHRQNAAKVALIGNDWRIDSRSDRQGLCLEGAPISAALAEQVSAPVAPGTIQLPPDGRPIVLLADAQTVGGYPRLGFVIAADLPRLAQLRAGDALRFAEVDTTEARAALKRRRDELARLHWSIELALASRAPWHATYRL
jgi:5-oxoprolinase (ATP-hydrolysing) subunit C